MVIYEGDPKVYLDETLGRAIEVYEVFDFKDEETKPLPRFVGKTQVPTPRGMMTVPFEIEATDIFEAVENYDKALETELQKLKEEAAGNKIIAPKKELII